MSKQYYKKTESMYGITFHPVDIGWRWCSEELPEEDGMYIVAVISEDVFFVEFRKGKWKLEGYKVVQWCKLPEPLTEDGDE